MKEPTLGDLMKFIVGMKSEIGELRNDILRLDSKVDTGFRKLDAKVDFRCDEILSATNAYATKTDRRLARLEAFHA